MEHASSIEFPFDRLLEPFKGKSKLFFSTLIRNSDTVRAKETNEYPPLRVQRTVYEGNVLILIVDILRKSCSRALIYRPIVLQLAFYLAPLKFCVETFFFFFFFCCVMIDENTYTYVKILIHKLFVGYRLEGRF